MKNGTEAPLKEVPFWRLPKEVRKIALDLGPACTDLYVALLETEWDLLGNQAGSGKWWKATIDMLLRRSTIKKTALLTALTKMEERGLVEVRRKSNPSESGKVKNEPNTYRLPIVAMNVGSENGQSIKYKKGKRKHNTPPIPLGEGACEKVQELFNEICHPAFPEVKKITSNRKKAISRCLPLVGGDVNDCREVFENFESSSLLKGEAQGAHGVGGFDWLMQEGNFLSLMEGTYADENRISAGIDGEVPF